MRVVLPRSFISSAIFGSSERADACFPDINKKTIAYEKQTYPQGPGTSFCLRAGLFSFHQRHRTAAYGSNHRQQHEARMESRQYAGSPVRRDGLGSRCYHPAVDRFRKGCRLQHHPAPLRLGLPYQQWRYRPYMARPCETGGGLLYK